LLPGSALISKSFLLRLGSSHRRFKSNDFGLERRHLCKELSKSFAGFDINLLVTSQGGFVNLLLSHPAAAQALLFFLQGSHFLSEGLERACLVGLGLCLGTPLKGNGQEGTQIVRHAL